MDIEIGLQYKGSLKYELTLFLLILEPLPPDRWLTLWPDPPLNFFEVPPLNKKFQSKRLLNPSKANLEAKQRKEHKIMSFSNMKLIH